MWTIESVTHRESRMDLSSSGQSDRDVTEVLFNGTVVANAVELTGWGEDAFQMFVCTSCGIEHCEGGNWLTARRCGEFVLFVPAFEWMSSAGRDVMEYAPPSYISQRGVPLLGRDLFGECRRLAPHLPEFDLIQQLSRREVALALSFEAPSEVLGEPFYPPDLRRDVLIAVSDGSLSRRIQDLEAVLSSCLEAGDLPAESSDSDLTQVITFYLDVPGFKEWRPLAFYGDTPVIRLDPGTVFARPSGSTVAGAV